ncbi:MAG: tRNA pseudouridine(38-40) synthase TruA, partial [Proteobacteria bacterium]|nr:tRNA pseudouridine(38-40) synthase TruA [Pseudomonadota bacterium]
NEFIGGCDIVKEMYESGELAKLFESKNIIEDKDKFLKSINHFLKNKMIAILNIRKRNQNFHARYSAKLRVYEYVIYNRVAPSVINQDRGWHIMKKLDLKEMKRGARKLIGTKDFSTFRASSCNAKSPIRTIKSVKIKNQNNKITIEFKSQSFLQQQVRSMVGCLKYLGEKKWDIKKFEKIIKLKKRENCAPPAPANGLFLSRVFY